VCKILAFKPSLFRLNVVILIGLEGIFLEIHPNAHTRCTTISALPPVVSSRVAMSRLLADTPADTAASENMVVYSISNTR
jgi:hypothetical protein